ncbi:hypothetical protein B0E41_08640 [Hydrogenophaga sp. A37]|nr:hypothetical protein B0E41_08640 [Hydrogenophaga sp. A37]
MIAKNITLISRMWKPVRMRIAILKYPYRAISVFPRRFQLNLAIQKVIGFDEIINKITDFCAP